MCLKATNLTAYFNYSTNVTTTSFSLVLTDSFLIKLLARMYDLITAQTMFCEMGHLVTTSMQVNGGKVLDSCAPDGEIKDVVTQ